MEKRGTQRLLQPAVVPIVPAIRLVSSAYPAESTPGSRGESPALALLPRTSPAVIDRVRGLSRAHAAGIPVAAIGCALSVLAAILIAHPYAEIPISDDFSYVRIAQVLARTGHIVYTGWVTPILGWQLYLAAVFIKLYGFSFTSVRASIMLVSVATAFLCQRTLVRAGINEWNASIATLTLLLSPLCMPVEVTFMTDIPGLFAIILCLYACLRAIQAQSSRSAMAWIGFAALSNLVLGSSRQISWLGVLVMVPSALWMLRRRRSVWMAGAGFWVLGAAFVFAINHWFQQQPYTQIELILQGHITRHVLFQLVIEMLRASFEMVLMLLPICLIFLPSLFRKRHSWQVYALGVLFVVGGLFLWHAHTLNTWYAPFLWGTCPFLSLAHGRPALTIAVVLCILAMLAAVLTRKGEPRSADLAAATFSDQEPSNRTIAVLVLPFTLAYLGLISPRAGYEGLWDRYLIPLLFVALLFFLRYYQQHFRTYLPSAALLLAICFGSYACASTHDQFALFRARASALQEVLDAGIPRTSVSGGWDFDGWTELQHSNHINAPRMRSPAGAVAPTSTHYGIDPCPWWYCNMYPHVVPRYGLALSPGKGPASKFSPVPYHPWVRPAGTFHVVGFDDPAALAQ